MKKIFEYKYEILIFFIILLIFATIRPNFLFLQTISLFLNEQKTTKEENSEISQYWNNPNKYFKILKKKQKTNIKNLYIKYVLSLNDAESPNKKQKETTKIHGEIFIKNNIQKEKTRINYYNTTPNTAIFRESIKKGRIEYAYDKTFTDEVPFVIKRLAMSPGNSIFDAIYDTKNFENFVYKGKMNHNKTKNTCDFWEFTYKPEKQNEKIDNIKKVEYCVDENLGFAYYINASYTSGKNGVLNINEIKYDVVKNNDIKLPKTTKVIIDMVWIQKLKLLFTKMQ